MFSHLPKGVDVEYTNARTAQRVCDIQAAKRLVSAARIAVRMIEEAPYLLLGLEIPGHGSWFSEQTIADHDELLRLFRVANLAEDVDVASHEIHAAIENDDGSTTFHVTVKYSDFEFIVAITLQDV